jgi:hypothetical protein
MKIVKILLYTTIVLEGGIAILCWFFPSYLKFISALQPLHGENTPKMLLAMYGSAVLLPVAISFWALREVPGSAQRNGLIILLILFHTLLSLSQFIYNPDARAGSLHLLIAAGLSSGWKKEKDLNK